MKLHDQNSPSKHNSPTCIEFDSDISAFVDGELDSIAADQLMDHLEACDHCQERIEQLRQMARLHRASLNPEEIIASMDGQEIFKGITDELLTEKIGKVAELFYEIGKACLLKGFKGKDQRVRSKNSMKHIFRARTRPLALENSRLKTSRLFREIEGITKNSPSSSRDVKRARSFFWSHRKASGGFLELGRRFIEESLSIEPGRAEPRLYLGAYFYAGKKDYKEAKKQFRKVLRLENLSEANRADALINLGSIHFIERNYIEANACYREVVKSGVVKRYPRYYRSIIFMAITYGKIGDFENSIASFKEIFRIFPKQIEKIRNEIWDLQTFKSMVNARQDFRKDLKDRIPVLFAS